MTQRLLVVCTGNICRSPVAAAVLRQYVSDIDVTSAGLHAVVGRGIDPESAAAAQAQGIALDAHIARQFTDELGRDVDMILVMENSHRHEIMARWPHLGGKTFLLGYFEDGKEIPDPYRRGKAMHLHMVGLVVESVRHWAEQLERLK
jgi:protein-tyrosine phosphatase